MGKIKVLVVDDRDVIRDSLKLILKGDEHVVIEATAEDGFEAISLIKEKQFDVILMDINMPNMNGIETTKKILQINPSLKVLVNSLHLSSIHIKDMINAGVSGFIKKGESKNKYKEAITNVANGVAHFSDEVNSKTYQEALSYLKYPSGNMISEN